MTSRRSSELGLGIASIVVATLFALVGQPLAGAEEERLATEVFLADAIFPAARVSGRQRVEIRIQRWSTDEQHEEVVEHLEGGGARALPRKLRRFDVTASIRETGRAAWSFFYAREARDGDERHIVLLADRRIVIAESTRRQRDAGFQTSLVTLDLDAQGRGEGELIPGTEVAYNETTGRLGPANRLVGPIELTNVRRR